MSLNWKEIDAVIDELTLPGCHIRKIRQPDFQTLLLDLYRPEGPFTLLISLAPGKTRIHRALDKQAAAVTLQRFAQFLRSRIKGGRITAVRQVASDRIVKLVVDRAGETTVLWARLWSSAANIIATGEGGIILDAFYRRPKRGEVSGGRYNPEEGPAPDKREYEVRTEFIPGEGETVNYLVAAFYGDMSEEDNLEAVRQRLVQSLSRREIKLSSTLEEVKKKFESSSRYEDYKHWGNLIMANLYRLKRGDGWLKLTSEDTGEAPAEIELDPLKSPVENGEAYFARYKKAKQGLSLLEEEKERLEGLRRRVRESMDRALAADSAEELRQETTPDGSGGNRRLRTDKDLPGLSFNSHGFTLLIGRNAKENDELLRKHVRGNDYWLHVRDYPGSYVFIKCHSGKSVPLEVLLDAGNLALLYSKGRQAGQADLYYTKVKYLRRARDGKRGTVIPTQEKNLHVRLDMDRVEKLKNAEA